MNRQPVSSSNVMSIGYDEATMTLEVEFQNGTVYQYYDVPEVIYQQLLLAPSAGRFLNENVKGVFRYSRM